MVTQRTEGLYRVFLFCQIIIAAALFWFGVWIMVTFYSEGGALTWGRYSIYCGMLVLGLILETLSRSKNFFLQNELLRPHRLSLRQTAASVGLLVLYLVAAKDAFISRVFLFNFVPWLYIALLFSHYYLPSLLARGIFRREDKTILVGSSQRVAQLREWLERKAEIGLREEPLENPLNRFLKRAIDIAIALPVMLVIFPVLAVIVFVVHRLQSPGPLFHVQNRAGMQNRQFKIYKFRTMHPNNGELSRQASEVDERVYPLGKWFRKLSIDEVPQFWNVLLGDMSIVGPRPHLIEHNQQFSKFMGNYHVRTFVKPGITGLAQVRGFRGEARNNADIENRVACDIEYLENWNPSLECGIILRTFAQLFKPPRSAY